MGDLLFGIVSEVDPRQVIARPIPSRDHYSMWVIQHTNRSEKAPPLNPTRSSSQLSQSLSKSLYSYNGISTYPPIYQTSTSLYLSPPFSLNMSITTAVAWPSGLGPPPPANHVSVSRDTCEGQSSITSFKSRHSLWMSSQEIYPPFDPVSSTP
jgi:hypothetical protein